MRTDQTALEEGTTKTGDKGKERGSESDGWEQGYEIEVFSRKTKREREKTRGHAQKQAASLRALAFAYTCAQVDRGAL